MWIIDRSLFLRLADVCQDVQDVLIDDSCVFFFFHHYLSSVETHIYITSRSRKNISFIRKNLTLWLCEIILEVLFMSHRLCLVGCLVSDRLPNALASMHA